MYLYYILSVVAVGVLRRGHNVGLGVLGVGDVGAHEPHEALRVDRDVLALREHTYMTSAVGGGKGYSQSK